MLDPSGHHRTPRISGSLGRATTLAVVTAALVAGAGLPMAVTAQAATLTPQRVGGVAPLPADAARIADPAGDAPLDVTVHLRSRDEAGAIALAAAVSDPTSPQYRQYLRTGEFAQRFGADKATVDKVGQALKAQGLTPGALEADGLSLPVHTTVAAAKKAFDTDFAGYRLADGSTALANTVAPALRGDVAGSVVGVLGLDTLARAHGNHVSTGKSVQVPAAKPGVGSLAASDYPQLCQTAKDQLNTRWGVNEGTDYFSASSLASVYGLNGLGDGGAGTTVAIFSLESYDPVAVQTFQSCYGTSASVTRIGVNTGQQAPPDNANVGVESALDIDTVVGLAPKANVLVYQGPDAVNASDAAIQATYRQIVTDNKAQVISSSWGVCDQVVDPSVLQAESDIFRQAALQGQSVVAASGDKGSSSCANLAAGQGFDPNQLSADDPAVQPYVTGVGGTTLTGGVASPSETVWNRNGDGSGGGLAKQPLNNADNFQAGFTAPGYANRCGAGGGQVCRQVPDVAAVADPSTGYVIATGQNYWTIMGGTSGAAPLWAAIAAHLNSSGKCAGRVGLLNQPLYKAAKAGRSPLNDITTGNNDVGTHGGLYAAAAGYDMATGLGTPKASQIVDQVCPAASTFVSLPPQRILDNRNNLTPGHGEYSLPVTGQGGIPASGVSAVVLNVTVTSTNSWGYLTAYPDGTTRPLSSNINWTAGQTIPNLVTVPVVDGKVNLYNGGPGATAFVVDVQGYYSTTAAGSQLKPVGPTRLLDTRDGSGHATVAGRDTVSLQVGGQAGVPATGVTAAVLNVTVTDTAGGGFLTAYPSGTTLPLASNLNWTPGLTIPNAVIVPVGADGKVNLYNGSTSGTDVIVDIAGYFSPSVSGGKFHQAGPVRQLDTRTDLSAPLKGGQVLPLALHDSNLRVPTEATSAVLNVTVTDTTAGGYLTVWPDGSAHPTASNLNWGAAGTTIANQVTVPVVNGKVDLAAFGPGTTSVVVDLFGYYSN